MKIEYRVKPVTRFIVTKYEDRYDGRHGAGSVTTIGEYSNVDTAYKVGYALCHEDHIQLGYRPGDDRIQYPKRSEISVDTKTES